MKLQKIFCSFTWKKKASDRPIEVKREVSNLSQKTGISLAEAAEFMKIFLSEAYNKTIAKLDKIMSEKVEE